MTPDDVARIVKRRDDAGFIDVLRAADAEFEDADFESALADVLRAEPHLIDSWQVWSSDQRWTPSAAVDGAKTAWVTPEGGSEHLRVHPDGASAVADFVHRMATWLARREVLARKE